jgi:hypothetical protein
MIYYLPQPYPHELFYSLMCRYRDHTGQTSFGASADFYGKQIRQFDFYFAANINSFMKNVPSNLTNLSTYQIINNHTLYPLLKSSLPIVKQKQLRSYLLDGKSTLSIMNLLPNIHKGTKICPICVELDIHQYGETYWNRLHNIPYWGICPIHNSKLLKVQSDVTEVKKRILRSAQKNIYNGKIEYGNNITQQINTDLLEQFDKPQVYQLLDLREDLRRKGIIRGRCHFDRKFIAGFKVFLEPLYQFIELRSKSNINTIYNEILTGNWRRHAPLLQIILKKYISDYQIIKREPICNISSIKNCRCGEPSNRLNIRKSFNDYMRMFNIVVSCLSCGYVYSLNPKKNIKTLDYGEKLITYIKTERKQGRSFNSLSRELKISSITISKLSVVKEWKNLHQTFLAKRDLARKQYLTEGKSFEWLWQRDRDWLNQAKRKVSLRKLNKENTKLNKKQRDIESIKDAFKKLRETNPQRRIGKNLIYSFARVSPGKLDPEIIQFINDNIENASDYKKRRILNNW